MEKENYTEIFVNSSTLKMEASGFSDSLWAFYETTTCHNAEGSNLQSPTEGPYTS
jgi:hypothetical protein